MKHYVASSDADLMLEVPDNIRISQMHVRVLPRGKLAKLLWRWLRFDIECSWAEVQK